MRGRFITLEGIEGSGKSTQMEFVATYLAQQGVAVVRTREPGGTELSEKIRDLLLTDELAGMHQDTELLMMFAARVEHVNKVILPALSAGRWVLSDRFYDATYAYQGYGRNIAIDRIDQLRVYCLGDLTPDKTLLLDVSLTVSQSRVAQPEVCVRVVIASINMMLPVNGLSMPVPVLRFQLLIINRASNLGSATLG